MDQQKFLELLKSVQIPDTAKVQGATAELRKTYYSRPESLIWLLQILTSHDSPQLQQQAAVEALRVVPKHWVSLPADEKPTIREKLLQSTLSGQTKLVRHSAARVISAIAKIDLPDGEWATLPGFLVQASTSKQVDHREVGVYVLFTLLEAAGDGFSDKLRNLLTLFGTTIKDPESQEVRINTMLALSRVAMLIEPEEDPGVVESFQKVIPAMVTVLKDVVDEGDEERAMQAFEVFQTLLGCDIALLATHFQNLVQFMIDLAAEASIADDSRSQALSFLMQCVKYRKLKVLGMAGMGEQLTTKSMQIATEISDDDDDDDELTPARSALGLLDLLASSLPPSQVVAPLLKSLPQYVSNSDPKVRKAGILSLAMCAEGAPDFMMTQLPEIIPIVLALLNDSDINVRQAALQGVSRLATEIAEDMSKEHEKLIPAIVKNLDASSIQSADPTEQKNNTQIMIGACLALDSLVDGMDVEVMSKYAPELVPRLGRLFSHPDFKVKAAAIGAMGSVAGSAEAKFLPYFEPTVKALAEYVTIKDSEEELEVRATVCDAMSAMAPAVGAAAFKPYLLPLMQASEEALHLGHPRLRETSYILWSTMAKVYEEDFTQFLEGVVKGLMECLEQEESEDLEVELGEEAADLVGQEVVIAGKKIKVAAAVDTSTDDIEDLDLTDDLYDDLEDWDDPVTAVALEKEIAVEVIGDVLSHTRQNFVPYLEKTVEIVMGLVEHSYEGVRKSAIATLWRAYACLWGLMEDHTGQKWQAGIPLKIQPTSELVKLGEVVTSATMGVWGDELDRAVVTDINRNISATLRLCGPAILTQSNTLKQITTILSAIVTRSHPCQLDLGDDEEQDEVEESSEYDWLVIDTALDVVIGLSIVLGEQFSETWKTFEKSIRKSASSKDNFERSTAVGVIAECTAGMGAAVTPYTATLLKLLLHRLTDEDPETRSNAAYAVGLLVENSTDSAAYLPSYNSILGKLEPLLHMDHARTMDNAAGCVCRMIMAHPDKVPIADVLPVLVELLPLKEDYEENKPIYECIVGLYQAGNATVQGLTKELLDVFEKVLGEPEEQLEADTRAKLVETIKYLAEHQPGLVKERTALLGLLNA